MNNNNNIPEGFHNLEALIDSDFGELGSLPRDIFEQECEIFILSERVKDERIKAGLTQEQLADRIGTKKSYISRIENGKADIQLSTLYKIFHGLGKRVSVTVL